MCQNWRIYYQERQWNLCCFLKRIMSSTGSWTISFTVEIISEKWGVSKNEIPHLHHMIPFSLVDFCSCSTPKVRLAVEWIRYRVRLPWDVSACALTHKWTNLRWYYTNHNPTKMDPISQASSEFKTTPLLSVWIVLASNTWLSVVHLFLLINPNRANATRYCRQPFSYAFVCFVVSIQSFGTFSRVMPFNSPSQHRPMFCAVHRTPIIESDNR